jgi:hypothetical protein
MNVDDYESLPETTKFTITLFAGACAGIMEHIVMYPVDTIKVIIACCFRHMTNRKFNQSR